MSSAVLDFATAEATELLDLQGTPDNRKFVHKAGDETTGKTD